MSRFHSFFLPHRESITDLPGLLAYLGEKVVIGNLCLYCPNGGKEFGSVDAVRKHMIDKAHCKMAYQTEEDQAEVQEFYEGGRGDEEWEDVDMGSDDEQNVS
jgi:pre-60S factor REI1